MRNELSAIGQREFWAGYARSRADFGALVEISSLPISPTRGKARDHEGVIAGTRGACAPQMNR
jgi:hypothetical protein